MFYEQVYRDRIQALAEGKTWNDPPVVKENLVASRGKVKPPLSGGKGVGTKYGNEGGWDNWDEQDHEYNSRIDMRRNQSVSDFRTNGGRGGMPMRCKSSEDMFSKAQLEASAANKEDFFAKKMKENELKPEGLPPSQGGKYVGFGSAPLPTHRSTSSQGDVLMDTVNVVSQV